MQKLLIVSHDVVGSNMAGPGIRYWELARALAAHTQVTLVAPRPIDMTASYVRTGSYTWGDVASLAAYIAHADVVLVNGFVFEFYPNLGEIDQKLMIDLYDPTLLENLELLRANPAERAARTQRDVALLNQQLAAGDFFLCATERQRDLYMGALMAAGRITPARVDADPLLRGLIAVLPFGLPNEPPVRSGPGPRGLIAGVGPDDPIILWSGGLWDWMDPQTLIRAMPTVLAAVPNARLVFMAGRHPGAAAEMRTPHEARTLADEIGLLGSHIFFYGSWVPYADRVNFLLDAAVVVSLHRQHLETAYAAVRSRFLDHLWAGRPSVVSAGDAAAELVERYDIGRVAPIGDEAAVARAICDLLADAALCAACAGGAQALAAEFSWERVSAPIRAFCAVPRRTRPVASHTSPPPTQASQPALLPTTTDTTMKDQTRNETIGRLDDLWKVQPQPLGSALPVLGQAKELANSLTRWYVQAIVDQQNAFNASVVQAIQALAANDDHRHTELTLQIHMLNNHLSQLRQSLVVSQRIADQLSKRLDELSRHLSGVDQRLDELSRHLSDVDDAETILAAAVGELRELTAALAAAKEEA